MFFSLVLLIFFCRQSNKVIQTKYRRNNLLRHYDVIGKENSPTSNYYLYCCSVWYFLKQFIRIHSRLPCTRFAVINSLNAFYFPVAAHCTIFCFTIWDFFYKLLSMQTLTSFCNGISPKLSGVFFPNPSYQLSDKIFSKRLLCGIFSPCSLLLMQYKIKLLTIATSNIQKNIFLHHFAVFFSKKHSFHSSDRFCRLHPCTLCIVISQQVLVWLLNRHCPRYVLHLHTLH